MRIHSNCECECDKACDVVEYIDYQNCRCRKKLVVKFVDECTEAVKEVRLTKITLTENENSYKCSSCTPYIVLIIAFFTISELVLILFITIGISLKMLRASSLTPVLRQQFDKAINEKS